MLSRGTPLILAAVLGAAMLHGRQAPDAAPFAARVTHAPIQVRLEEDGSLSHSQTGGVREATVASETTNWSGYATAKYQTKETYTAAAATWTVPTVSFGPTKSPHTTVEYSSAWVGIGGFCENARCSTVDQSLIQLGTEADAASDGQTQYYAWYELLPAGSFLIPITVRPGDSITASLTCTANCTKATQTWELTMVDGSQSWTKTFTYKSSRLSTVFIEEAPTGRGGILPLSKPAAPVTFAATTANGAPTGDLSVTKNGIAMINPAGQTSMPSNTTGDAFDACWGYQDAKDLAVCHTPVDPLP